MVNEEHWRGMRESGFRILFAGAFSLVIAFVLYSRFSVPSSGLTVTSQNLTNLAYPVLAITGAAMASVLYGGYTILRSEQLRSHGTGSLLEFLTRPFDGKNFWRIVVVSALGYGIVFGFLSQILVYRPDVSFTEKGLVVPSTEIIPCCSAPGYVPMFTAYITDHFLILVIPVNVILATIVSSLVGLNAGLSIYAYRVRQSVNTKNSVIGGIGATTGLFVGCPTCAGSLFSALLGIGVAGAGTSAAVLAPFQTLFIAASIPALVIAPLFIARGIRSVSNCRLS
ncbi:MAG TPA: hypothetical protein VJP79_05600 [Nitrososphaera sp.]|nr:hypothetical protein [Nitrososphaera sp.]